MCIICIELEKESLTLREAASNYRELEGTLDRDHSYDLFEELWNEAISKGDYEAMKNLTNLSEPTVMAFLKRKEGMVEVVEPVKDAHDEYWDEWDENDYFGTD